MICCWDISPHFSCSSLEWQHKNAGYTDGTRCSAWDRKPFHQRYLELIQRRHHELRSCSLSSGQQIKQCSLSPLSKANTNVNGSNTPMPQTNLCLSVFLIEPGLQSKHQESTFWHLPECGRVPGAQMRSPTQVPPLISTALFLLGNHWQNPAQEYHLAFLQHFTDTNQWAQHHQIR